MLHHIERPCEAPGDVDRAPMPDEPKKFRVFDCFTAADGVLHVFRILFNDHSNEKELLIAAIWHEGRAA